MSFTLQLPEISFGIPAIDKLHHDLSATLGELSAMTDKDFGIEYPRFVKQVEDMFRQEEQCMEDIPFRDFKAHQEQHARVLGALHNVHSRVMAEEITLGREVVDDLFPQWLAFHIETMDISLALAMKIAKITREQPIGN